MNESSKHDGQAVVFAYTESEVVPADVTHVRIDPSITIIPCRAFRGRIELREVALHENVLEVGQFAFHDSGLSSLNLPDGVEHIQMGAFHNCSGLTNVRIPPLIGQISEMALCGCSGMFSLELPEGVTRICSNALSNCRSLRNVVAIPSIARMGESAEGWGNMFHQCKALRTLCGSSVQIKHALLRRFDGLPLHRLMYYQSYYSVQMTLGHIDDLVSVRKGRDPKLRSESIIPASNQRDSLGMTPLHILSCSKRQNIDLVRVVVEACPDSLVAEDGWGGLPILYAVWGAAPEEVIQFLCESHKRFFSNHLLPWESMIKTLSENCHPPVNVLENLIHVQQAYFPDQVINWDGLLNDFAGRRRISIESYRFLIRLSAGDCLRSIGIKLWRTDIMKMIETTPDGARQRAHVDRIRSRLATAKREFQMLKYSTTMLELALWKLGIDKKKRISIYEGSKKMKADDSDSRRQCRFTCRADSVIAHVLPFLVPHLG